MMSNINSTFSAFYQHNAQHPKNENKATSSSNVCEGFKQLLRSWNLTDRSSLDDKEIDVLRQIEDRISSTLNVEVKVFDGTPHETSRGIALFSVGFTSTDETPFVISQQWLSLLANDEKAFEEFKQWLGDAIDVQKTNTSFNTQMNLPIEKTISEKAMEHFVENKKNQLDDFVFSRLNNLNDLSFRIGIENRMMNIRPIQEIAKIYEDMAVKF